MKKFITAAVLAIAALPAPASAQSRDDDWERITRAAAAMPGARYPDGSFRVAHECYPSSNKCGTTLAISPNGILRFQIIEFKDIDDRITDKLICKFNANADMMSCVNFDTNKEAKSVKVKGKWVAVESWNEEAQRRMDYNPWLDNGRAWMHTFQK